MSFSRIEEARKNPVRFAARAVSGKKPFFSHKNFRAFFFKALREFHAGKAKRLVLSEFDNWCDSNLSRQANYQARFQHYRRVLALYCDSYGALGCRCIETRKKALLNINTHSVTGLIDRFDLVLPVGYRATMTQLYDLPWKHDLRWPLLQKAVSDEMGCAVEQVQVGIFCLETGAYDYHSFSDPEVTNAVAEAESVLSAVEANLPP